MRKLKIKDIYGLIDLSTDIEINIESDRDQVVFEGIGQDAIKSKKLEDGYVYNIYLADDKKILISVFK